jgi:periplasmic divalent cation tolerance protein
MTKSSHIVVLITTRKPEEAQNIAEALVKKRLAACVNIIPEVNSHFRWQNKLNTTKECMLIVKTKESLLPAVIESVKKIHSHLVPEIIALPIIGGSQDYLDWLDIETN